MPGFIMANMMRDTLSAYVTSGANFVPIASTLKGFTQDMQELERAGVVGGYDYSKDPKDIGSYLNTIMKGAGLHRRFICIHHETLLLGCGILWVMSRHDLTSPQGKGGL